MVVKPHLNRSLDFPQKLVETQMHRLILFVIHSSLFLAKECNPNLGDLSKGFKWLERKGRYGF